MNKIQKFETQWGGKTLSIEVGKYAAQANGACLVQYGETVVLATATLSSNKRDGIDYLHENRRTTNRRSHSYGAFH
jgi:polyribonucleotide nucleotidyltransferase